MTEQEREIAALRLSLASARLEIAADDALLKEANRVLDAIPCPRHGRCVPYALDKIGRLEIALGDIRNATIIWRKDAPGDTLRIVHRIAEDALADPWTP